MDGLRTRDDSESAGDGKMLSPPLGSASQMLKFGSQDRKTGFESISMVLA